MLAPLPSGCVASLAPRRRLVGHAVAVESMDRPWCRYPASERFYAGSLPYMHSVRGISAKRPEIERTFHVRAANRPGEAVIL